jgi:hypothetical protein
MAWTPPSLTHPQTVYSAFTFESGTLAFGSSFVNTKKLKERKSKLSRATGLGAVRLYRQYRELDGLLDATRGGGGGGGGTRSCH